MQIKFKCHPFEVPELVILGDPEWANMQPESKKEKPLTLPLKDIDEESLSDLCDKFRDSIFDKALKRDPKKHGNAGRKKTKLKSEPNRTNGTISA